MEVSFCKWIKRVGTLGKRFSVILIGFNVTILVLFSYLYMSFYFKGRYCHYHLNVFLILSKFIKKTSETSTFSLETFLSNRKIEFLSLVGTPISVLLWFVCKYGIFFGGFHTSRFDPTNSRRPHLEGIRTGLLNEFLFY